MIKKPCSQCADKKMSFAILIKAIFHFTAIYHSLVLDVMLNMLLIKTEVKIKNLHVVCTSLFICINQRQTLAFSSV